MKKIIAGCEVDLSHPSFKDVKSAADIKKLEIFNHLDEAAETAACKELLDALKKGKAPAPAEE